MELHLDKTAARRHRLVTAIGLVATLGLLAAGAGDAAAATRAGFALRDITPTGDLRGICLGGYGALTCREATGVHDHLFARALAIESGSETVVVVSLDLVGASNGVTKAIAAAANQPSAIVDPSRVVVAETHSHATPDLVGLWGHVTDDYRRFVISEAAGAVRAAVLGLREARLFVGATSFGATTNRRGWPATDPDLTVIDARDAGGAHIGTLVSFAAHPTVLGSGNHLISRDWVGAMIDRVEATTGASTALFVNGAVGDVLPATDATGGGVDDFDRLTRYGQAVGDTALGTLAGAIPLGDGLVFARTTFSQCVTNEGFLLARVLGLLDYDLDTSLTCGLTGLLVPQRLKSQVAYLRLGREVQIAILPGEALTRLTLDGAGALGFPTSTGALKPAMKARFKVVFGMATDFLGYFVPGDEWNSPKARKNPLDSDYEEGVSLGSPADRWIRDRAKALVTTDNARF